MPKTQIKCPSCGQPVVADIQQLFDVGNDPAIKNRLLSGAVNLIHCPTCGYQGSAATPIVYHDPEKELLLTYFPPELAVPRDEQEKIIGPLITQVFNALPQEQRKAYLFSPVTMLTYKSLVEKILEADGITKEMLEAQEKRAVLLQRLLEASEESRETLIREGDALIDKEFFYLFSRIYEAALMSNDQSSVSRLNKLQEQLLVFSTYGHNLKKESDAFEEAANIIQGYGEKFSRENLLDEVIKSSDDARLRAFVKLARSGMDYVFFQQLSEKIDHAADDDLRQKLLQIREKLLALTKEEDELVKLRVEYANKNIEALLSVENPEETIAQNQAIVDEFFVHALEEQLANARQKGDLEKSGKLANIVRIIEKLAAPPPEFAFLNELLEAAEDPARLAEKLGENEAMIDDNFLNLLSTLIQRTGEETGASDGQAELADEQQKMLIERLNLVYQEALRISMEKKLK